MKFVQFFIVVFFIFNSSLYSSQKIANEIAEISSIPLNYLDRHSLKKTIQDYMRSHPQIKAIKITEDLTKEIYISIIKIDNELIDKSFPSKTDKNFLQFEANSYASSYIVGRVVIIVDPFYKSKLQNLTNREKKYIDKIGSINLCLQNSYRPLEFLNQDKKADGIYVDILKLTLDKVGLTLNTIFVNSVENSIANFTKKRCDLIFTTKKRSQKNNFSYTKPIVTFPIVITTKNDTIFIDEFQDISDRKFTLLKGYIEKNQLKEQYPKTTLIEVSSVDEGLNMVENDKVFGFIEILPTVINRIKSEGYLNLKINGKLDKKVDISIAIDNQNKTLISIINKAINAISKEEKNKILNRWDSIKYQKHISHTLLIKIALFVALLILIVLLWNYTLRNKIKKEIKKNKEQESILYYYSKQKSMQDLVGNIAHQWKQPLIELSAGNLYLETKLSQNLQIDQEELKNYLSNNTKILNFMSNTIDTFNNFYQVQNKNSDFNLFDTIKNTIFIFQHTIFKNHITIDLEIDKQIKIYGDPFSFQQILLSLFANSKEVFSLKDTKEPKIKIKAYIEDSNYIVIFQDNGGGIDQSILNSIFIPGFTTLKNGSGVGLFIVKKIVHEKFNGKIEPENTQDGVKFIITLNSTT